ncbi:hypothetical protein HYQ46_011949 [Verticillium longisporum]|nr:hypothetical protein HYQ46_011949 [Verticillium longisporum]
MKCRRIRFAFYGGDQLSSNADTGMRRWHGAVTSRGANNDLHVHVALLRDARQGEQLTPGGNDARALIEDQRSPVFAVAVDEKWREVRCALRT